MRDNTSVMKRVLAVMLTGVCLFSPTYADEPVTHSFSEIFKLQENSIIGYRETRITNDGSANTVSSSIKKWTAAGTGYPEGVTHIMAELQPNYEYRSLYGVGEKLLYYGYDSVNTTNPEAPVVTYTGRIANEPLTWLESSVTDNVTNSDDATLVVTRAGSDTSKSYYYKTEYTLVGQQTVTTDASPIPNCFRFETVFTSGEMDSTTQQPVSGGLVAEKQTNYFHPLFAWVINVSRIEIQNSFSVVKQELVGGVVEGKAYPENDAAGLISIGAPNAQTGLRPVYVSLFGDRVVDAYITIIGPQGKVAAVMFDGLKENQVTPIAQSVSLPELMPNEPFNIKVADVAIPSNWPAGKYLIDLTLTAAGATDFEVIYTEEVCPFTVATTTTQE